MGLLFDDYTRIVSIFRIISVFYKFLRASKVSDFHSSARFSKAYIGFSGVT